jgi:hypothetical protein
MASNTVYNHRTLITDIQPANIKSVYNGTIVSFKYKGQNINDKTPMVLILWNDHSNSKIHGINLNYLTQFKLIKLFDKLIDKGKNPIVQEDQDDVNDYDDSLPYRNMLKDPYTRVQLPTYKMDRGGNPLSSDEAVTQMNRLYEKNLKKIVTKSDIYRTYHQKKMAAVKAITLNIQRLIK